MEKDRFCGDARFSLKRGSEDEGYDFFMLEQIKKGGS